MTTCLKLLGKINVFLTDIFCVLLFSIIRRLATLLSSQAGLLAENEAALKQAASASKAASAIIDQQASAGSAKKSGSDESTTKLQAEIRSLKDGILNTN